jgi:uncharacterized membrane protein
MLYELIASSTEGGLVLYWIEIAALAIEILAIAIIVVSIAVSTVRALYRVVATRMAVDDYFREYKHSLGRALLLGLEILVAADIVRTVALEATLRSVIVLGLLVLIRTFLSWSLVVEIEGRWPWQPRRKAEIRSIGLEESE